MMAAKILPAAEAFRPSLVLKRLSLRLILIPFNMMRALALFTFSCMLLLASCHPKNGNPTPPQPPAVEKADSFPTGGIKPLPGPTPAEVQQRLITQYERGEIEQCLYKGATVYRCSRNAPDAGSEVFDAKGDRIGRCYFSTNTVDPVCREATDCKVIYRVAKNIWGKPEVVWVKPN